jgi:cytochrome P450
MSGKTPPGPKRKPIGGHLLEFRRDPTGFLLNAAQTYGDVVNLKFGLQVVYLINHPDYIRDALVTHSRNFIKSRGLQMPKRFLGEGLLTSEGDFHRRQRRLGQPAFHKQRINAYGHREIRDVDFTHGIEGVMEGTTSHGFRCDGKRGSSLAC